MMTDAEKTVSDILSGHSLAVYLEPDETLFEERETPEYWECYELPNIKLEGGLFFAYSEPNHLAGAASDPITEISSYCYTNFANFFLNFSCASRLKALQGEAVSTLIMSRKRYKTFSFLTKANYRQVWDSHDPTPVKDLVSCLKQGLKFKAALLDQNGIWHIHPVDLPFYWPDTDKFQIQTHLSVHPGFLVQPQLFKEKLVPQHPIVFSPDTPRPDATLEFEAPPANSFFSAFSDGTYFTAGDRNKGGDSRPYERLKLFCENLS